MGETLANHFPAQRLRERATTARLQLRIIIVTERADGWAPDVPMGLAGPFSESMRFGEWPPGLLFRCLCRRVHLMAGMEGITMVASAATTTLSRAPHTEPDGAWFLIEP